MSGLLMGFASRQLGHAPRTHEVRSSRVRALKRSANVRRLLRPRGNSAGPQPGLGDNRRRRGRKPALALLVFAAAFSHLAGVSAAELTVFTPRSIWTVLNEIGPQFERTTGYKLDVQTDLAAALAHRIVKGQSFDVFI